VLLSAGLTLFAFGTAIAAALVPLISVELVLIGMVLEAPHLPWWLLALVVTLGQMVGKLLYFYAGRGSLCLPGLLRHKSTPSTRWTRWMTRFRDTCHRRPRWTAGVLLVSALFSLPPFAATAIAAGVGHVPTPTFLITGFTGRFTRFAILAAAPSVGMSWFGVH